MSSDNGSATVEQVSESIDAANSGAPQPAHVKCPHCSTHNSFIPPTMELINTSTFSGAVASSLNRRCANPACNTLFRFVLSGVQAHYGVMEQKTAAPQEEKRIQLVDALPPRLPLK